MGRKTGLETRSAGEVEANQMKGTIRKIKEGVWEARLWNGWWVAFGKTPEAAKKKVIRNYERETRLT